MKFPFDIGVHSFRISSIHNVMNKVLVSCRCVVVDLMDSLETTVAEVAAVHGFLPVHVRSQFLFINVHLAAVASTGAIGSSCAEQYWKVRAVHSSFRLITKTC